jgi:hypothetical protein
MQSLNIRIMINIPNNIMKKRMINLAIFNKDNQLILKQAEELEVGLTINQDNLNTFQDILFQLSKKLL